MKLTCRLIKDSEYNLRESGLLHIGQLAFNHTQFCLQVFFCQHSTFLNASVQYKVNSDGTYMMEARVCTLTLEEHSNRIETVNGNIIPALLIISECCLFLTFLLHVIVPDFRRQIFGKDIFQMCYAIASPLSRMDEDVYGGESLSRLSVVHHNILW